MPSDNDLDYYSDEVEKISYSKQSKRTLYIKEDETEDEIFGWNLGNDPTVYAQRAIKRFRLKRLKSFNKEVYYYDNVSYHIWQYSKDSTTGVEKLLKPSDDICKKLREVNEIRYEPYMWQPEEFW